MKKITNTARLLIKRIEAYLFIRQFNNVNSIRKKSIKMLNKLPAEIRTQEDIHKERKLYKKMRPSLDKLAHKLKYEIEKMVDLLCKVNKNEYIIKEFSERELGVLFKNWRGEEYKHKFSDLDDFHFIKAPNLQEKERCISFFLEKYHSYKDDYTNNFWLMLNDSCFKHQLLYEDFLDLKISKVALARIYLGTSLVALIQAVTTELVLGRNSYAKLNDGGIKLVEFNVWLNDVLYKSYQSFCLQDIKDVFYGLVCTHGYSPIFLRR